MRKGSREREDGPAMNEHTAENDVPRCRYMPAIHGQLAPIWEGAALLRLAADVLEAQPPKLQSQYVAALRLYADEPWRLTRVTPPDAALADAWDEGYDAGHQDARAVQPTYPEPTRNPYRVIPSGEVTNDES
jgi:hypothetical protein